MPGLRATYKSSINFIVFISLVCISAVFSVAQASEQCAAAFVDGVTNSSADGSISFSGWGQLQGNPDLALASANVYSQSWYNDSCQTADCVSGGASAYVNPLSAQFIANSANTDLYYSYQNVNVTGNDYRYVTATSYSQVSFSSAHSSFYIYQLYVDYNAEVNLPAGDYYIDSLLVNAGGRINVIGSGTVRIFAKSQLYFGSSAEINGGESGNPEQLFIYHFGEYDSTAWILYGAKVSGYIYSENDVYVGGWYSWPWQSVVNGGISANGNINVTGTSIVEYDGNGVSQVDFGDNCQSDGAGLHHIEISHDGNGQICEIETVTITACADAACSSTFDDPISLDLTLGGTVKQTVNISGQNTASFSHTSLGAATLGIDNLSQASQDSLVCNSNPGSSCQITYTDVGCSNSNSCAATFPDGASNTSNSGWVYFYNHGYIQNSPDNILHTRDLYQNSNNYPSCQTAFCSANNDIVPSIDAQFVSTNSRTNFTASNGSPTVITSNQFKYVTVNGGYTLTMDSQYDEYRFKELYIANGGTVYLTEGDYYIKNLYVNGGFLKVHPSVTGTVRVFVQKEAQFYGNARVNDDVYGDPNKLLVYHFGNGNSSLYLENTQFAGYLYSKKYVTITDGSTLYGAATAKTGVTISDAGNVQYVAPTTMVLDGMCGTPVVSVNHYRFEYDASGLTCKTQALTIKACADANCSALASSASSLTLNVDSTNSSSTNVSFTGSTSVTIAESLPTTVVLSASNASPTAALSCYENGGLDNGCDYQLNDTGFIFTNEDEIDPNKRFDFPTQIAGKPSDEGYNRVTMAIQAVQTNVNTGACDALFADNSQVAVNLAYSCTDPNTCSANVAAISNNGQSNNIAQYPSYQSVDLLFSQNSKAFIAMNYADVGKIKLHGQKSIVLNPSAGNATTTTLTGSSQDITVRPFAFRLDVPGNTGAIDATGGVFTKAGEPFAMNVSAVAWQSGQDSDSDGHPDNNDDISANLVTPNYGQETQPEAVNLLSALVSPVSGNNPAISNGTFSAFSQGIAAKTNANGPSWPEVGVISLTATGDGSYLDSNEQASGYIANVGRFVPHHFTVVNASITQQCTNFSYMDQQDLVNLHIQAREHGDVVVENYNSGVGGDFHANASINLVAEHNNDGLDLGGRLTPLTLSWQNGELNSQYNSTFARSTIAIAPNNIFMDGPFDDLQVGIQLVDGEASASIDFDNVLDMNADSSGNCAVGSNCNAVNISDAGVSYRYGRLQLTAAYGPASSAQVVPIQTQIWNGSKFVLSNDDNCSSLQASDINISGRSDSEFTGLYGVLDLSTNNQVGSTNVDLTATNTSNTGLQIGDGEFDLTLTPPDFDALHTSMTGYISVTVDVTSYPWLQFDWNNVGTGAIDISDKTLPMQQITFGQFRGNDRVIYWREKL